MDEFLAVLTSVSRAVKAHLESRLLAHGVHAGQQFILESLWREDGQTPGELAQRTGTRTFSYGPSPEDSAFYMLEGEAIFASGGTTVHATAGTFLFLPRNLSFHYEVGRLRSARMLVWTTPLGFAHEVTHMGTPGQALVLPPPRLLDQEKMQLLATLLRNTTRPVERS